MVQANISIQWLHFLYSPNIYNTLLTDAFLLTYWWATTWKHMQIKDYDFLKAPSNILYSPWRLLAGSRCCYSNFLSVTTNFSPFCHAHLQPCGTVICLLFVLVYFQARAKFYTCNLSDLSLFVSVILWKHLSFLSVCLTIQILFSCPPAASFSVQSPQAFVAIIIILSQHALCPLEGWFDRSSLVICLKADFSSSLQHCAYEPPPLQVFNVELVLPELLLVALPPEERLQGRRCTGLQDTEPVW